MTQENEWLGRLFNGETVRVCGQGCPQAEGMAENIGLPTLAPGIVDLQINGFAGVDFNDGAITFDAYVHAMQTLRRQCVTTVLPTLITNDPGFIAEQLARLEGFRRRCEETFGDSALGMRMAYAPMYHLEGPFISPVEGYRGAHPEEYVRPALAGELERAMEVWDAAAPGRVAVMTFSPHDQGAGDFLRVLWRYGVLPAIGHSHATGGQIDAALALARAENIPVLATHLGNATPAMLPRHDNPVWHFLADDTCHVSMIADGFHLPAAMLKTFIRALGDRAIVVSDATGFAGQPPGSYTSHIGGEVVLTPEGKLHVAGSPKLLAGAARGAFDGWKYLVSLGFMSPGELWKHVSDHPFRFLSRKPGCAVCPRPYVVVQEG